MPETISIHLLAFSGETELNLFLRRTDTGALVNTAGDALVEAPASSGRFTATLAESRVGLDTLAASVCEGAESAADLVWDGWLGEDVTLCTDTYPSTSGGGGGGLTTAEGLQLDRIEAQTAKLSGTPVTVNGNVKPGGQIVLHHGDNHTVAGGNSVIVGVDDVGGSLHTLMLAVGVGNLEVAAIRGADPASRIVGTVAALNYASNILSVTMEFTSTESAKGIVGPAYNYDVIRTSTPTRTYFSGRLTVVRDAR